MIIRDYSINDYWCLLMVIGGYSIVDIDAY